MKAKRSTRHRRVLRRYSAEDRKRLIEQYRLSGQSKSAFCRDQQINLTTFCGWFSRERTMASGFAEVTLKAADAGMMDRSASERIEMHLPGGVRLFFPDPGSPSRMCQLICKIINHNAGGSHVEFSG